MPALDFRDQGVELEGAARRTLPLSEREWPGAWRGAWHLFGHVHGNLDEQPLGYSLDVGVDSHGYAPLAVEEVVAIMATREKHFGS